MIPIRYVFKQKQFELREKSFIYLDRWLCVNLCSSHTLAEDNALQSGGWKYLGFILVCRKLLLI